MALKAGRVGVAPDQVDPYGNLKGGEHYVLPVASANTLGGVKIGNGLSITDGVLSADAPDPYELPTASAETLGGIKVGSGLSINDGVLSVAGGSGLAISAIDNVSFTFVYASATDPGPWLFLDADGLAGGTQLPDNVKIVGFVPAATPSENSDHWNLVSLQPVYRATAQAPYRNRLYCAFYRKSGSSTNLRFTVTGTVYYVSA